MAHLHPDSTCVYCAIVFNASSYIFILYTFTLRLHCAGEVPPPPVYRYLHTIIGTAIRTGTDQFESHVIDLVMYGGDNHFEDRTLEGPARKTISKVLYVSHYVFSGCTDNRDGREIGTSVVTCVGKRARRHTLHPLYPAWFPRAQGRYSPCTKQCMQCMQCIPSPWSHGQTVPHCPAHHDAPT